MNAGEKLRMFRNDLNMNQEDFGAMFGASQAEVSRQEKEYRLKPIFIKKLLVAFPELDASELYPDDVLQEPGSYYGRRKPLITIDTSLMEEKIRRLEEDVAFLRELILKQVGTTAEVKEEQLT